jgi:flagellar basal-body rod protein FlgF
LRVELIPDMENASFVALSRQMVLQRQMDLIANNIANISTPAFKGERMVFIEYLAKTDDSQNLSYVEDIGQVRDTAEGSMTPTGNTFDLGIKGNGYFTVDTPNGQRYTRNGRFTLDGTGRLTTSDGYALLDSNNQPIVVPEDANGVVVSEDGTVSAGASDSTTTTNQIGRIKLASFANDQDLSMTGNGLYSTDQPPQPAPDASVLQGMVEESNVQPVIEITRMIAAHRAFDATQNLIQTDDDMEREAIDKLTRTS